MVAFRLHFVKWEHRPDRHNMEGPFFRVFAQAEAPPFQSIHALITPSALYDLQHETGLQGFHSNDRVQQAVIRYAIQRIEHGLREGLFPTEPSRDTTNLPLEEADVLALRQLLQDKTCSYQLQEGRDLLCSAARAEDKTVHGKSGFRFVAPTSRAMCYTCSLPDTDYLCAHFLHPEVHTTRDSGARMVRQLVQGMCDIGRDEVQQPEQCRAGGHGCWEWLIEPRLEQLAIPASPLALPEALDFLDTAWRVAFGKRQALLRLRNTTSIAKLSQVCTTRADFESQLSALADILKAMDIPDALLSETQKIDKDQTFMRLLDCMQVRLEESDYQEVERAVSTLRTVNEVRVALQHSGASRDLPTSLVKLGIPYPPQWRDAWDRIRVATIEALRIVREKVLKHATESS
jgi:hypothetical protein